MIRTFALLILLIVSVGGCDPIAHTKIEVRASPTDTRGLEQINADIIAAVNNSAERFGFRKVEGENAHVYTSDVDPNIWMRVYSEENLGRIDIAELYTDHPGQKHLDFVDALIVALKTRELDVRITFQTPNSSGWICPVIFITFVAIVACLLWTVRNNRRKGFLGSPSN